MDSSKILSPNLMIGQSHKSSNLDFEDSTGLLHKNRGDISSFVNIINSGKYDRGCM